VRDAGGEVLDGAERAGGDRELGRAGRVDAGRHDAERREAQLEAATAGLAAEQAQAAGPRRRGAKAWTVGRSAGCAVGGQAVRSVPMRRPVAAAACSFR
jgi:hypothetical protein